MPMTAADKANHRYGLGIAPRFPGAVQIALAARAQALRIHVGAVMPATFAFFVLAGFDLDLDRRAFLVADGRPRGDQHVAQFVAETGQRVTQGTVRLDIQLRGQGGADLLRFAFLLDPLGYDLAELAYVLPLVDDRLIEIRVRKLVPGLLEHAPAGVAGEYAPCLVGGKAEDRRHQAQQA